MLGVPLLYSSVVSVSSTAPHCAQIPLTLRVLLLEASFLWARKASEQGAEGPGFQCDLLLAHNLDTGTILRAINSDPGGTPCSAPQGNPVSSARWRLTSAKKIHSSQGTDGGLSSVRSPPPAILFPRAMLRDIPGSVCTKYATQITVSL